MKKFLALITTLALMQTSCFAMTAKQEGAKTVVLEGNANEANVLVAVDVFVEGKSKDDLASMLENGEDILNIFVERTQTKTDENGDFSVSFDIDLPTGKYTAFAGTLTEELEPYTFIFVSETEYNDFSESFSADDALVVKDIIDDENKCYILGVTEEEAKALNSSELSKVITNSLAESGVDIKDRDKVWAEIDRAYFVAQLNEGKIESITEVSDELSKLSDSKMYEWLDSEIVTEKVKEGFTKNIQNQDFASVKAYEDGILEAFILAVVKNAGGTDDVKEIVTAFENEIGVNVTNSTPKSVWNKLLGKDYDSFSELEDAFDDYEDEGDTIGSGSSSSGSSGDKKKPAISGEIIVPQNNTVTPVTVTGFSDLENVSWAKDAILYLADKNIVSGIGNNMFNPNGLVTREQLAKIVVGAFAPTAEAGAIDFTDVNNGDWYYEFIAKAKNSGIVSGMGDGTFGVGKNVTRQDMCVMIYNAAKAYGVVFDAESDTFADDAKIADYAKEAVYALKNKGAVSGMDEFNFAPGETATRAQVAKIIHYLLVK